MSFYTDLCEEIRAIFEVRKATIYYSALRIPIINTLLSDKIVERYITTVKMIRFRGYNHTSNFTSAARKPSGAAV
jgi:hypothetical protein